jgi:hypothetical protein
MKTALIATRVLTSLLGISLLGLGILFWLGYALTLFNVHMTLGALLVLCLWVLVALGLRARVSTGLILVVLGFSLLMPWFGVMQMRLLPGQYHWLIQVLHLLIGMGAVGLGQILAGRIGRQGAPS